MPRRTKPAAKDLRTLILLIGMGVMLPCYLFTVGNVLLSPWPLYERNRAALCALTLVCCALLFCIARAFEHCAAFLARHMRSISALTLALFAACQLVAALHMRMGVISDLDSCYYGAMDYLETGAVRMDNLIPMCTTPNNFALFFIILKVMQALRALGLSISPYLALMLLNIALFGAGLLCLLRSAYMLGGAKAQALTAVNMALCLPMLYCTCEIYTDAFCAPFLMMSVYAILRLSRAESARSFLLWSAACGALLLIGFEIRATIIIPIIALCIVVPLRLPVRRWCCLLLVAAIVLPGHAAFMRLRSAYYGEENLERYSMPVAHWLVMGTPDEYGYFYGQFSNEDFKYAFSIEDPHARKAALTQRWKDKVYRLRRPDRLLSAVSRKNLAIFGNGAFGFDHLIAHDGQRQEAFSALFLDKRSESHPPYRHLTTAMLLAQMLFACAGCAQLLRRRQAAFGDAFLYIALVGIFLFLMLWEAGSRYFFHFAPVLLLASALAQSRLTQRHADGAADAP